MLQIVALCYFAFLPLQLYTHIEEPKNSYKRFAIVVEQSYVYIQGV